VTAIPFSILDPDNPGFTVLVLAVTDGCLLVGPRPGQSTLRVVRLEDGEVAETMAVFGRVYFDRPWHADFSIPQPAPAEHEH